MYKRHRPIANDLTPSFIEERSQPVTESGCWLWDRYCKPDGYGHMRSHGKKILAHRASYIAYHGPIPDGMIVRHKCDTPQCVNPEHLVVGTAQDNSNDRAARGRTARGDKVGRTKLSDQDVRDIRASTLSYSKIAAQYGIYKSYVTAIRSRRERPYVE